MTKKDYEETEEPVEEVDEKPAGLREDDEITDAEEAFMEGYESDMDDSDEEEEEKEKDFEEEKK